MNAKLASQLAGLLGVFWLAPSAFGAEAPASRQEILALGKSVVGYSYWWGNAAWDPANVEFPGHCQGSCGDCEHSASDGGPEYGADCSGLIGHAWRLTGTSSPVENSHPYSTHDFRYETTHWAPIDRSDALPGDALVRNDGSSGHIVLFENWASDGSASIYECSGCSTGCIHSTRPLSSDYIAIRREGAASDPQPGEADGELAEASCEKISGWATLGSGPAEVLLTFDGPSHSKFAKRRTVATDTEHAFELSFPETLKDGKRHSLFAYIVDAETGQELLLVGAPVGLRCGSQSNVTPSCSHGACSVGAALDAGCDACTANVCLLDAKCCSSSGSWDQSCVALAADSVGSCSGACAGGASSCKHDECKTGAALSASCSDCASHVCERDAFCCEDEWDWICAKEAGEDPFCSCPT